MGAESLRVANSFARSAGIAQRLTHLERADDAVFMEAIAPIRTAERRAIGGEQFMIPSLRGRSPRVEDRVVIIEPSQHLLRVDVLFTVECDAEDMPRADMLQDVHVVCHRGLRGWFERDEVIPTGPRSPPARQQ